MKNTPLREQRFELNRILKEHEVPGMRSFILKNRSYFPDVAEEQIEDNQYVHDLMHVYKALLFYFGEQSKESMQYCLDHGLIAMDEDARAQYDKASKEIQTCIITPELVQESAPKPSADS